MEYPYFTGQAPIPLQSILQPHTNSRYQDQRQQRRECQPADHRNGKRCTDSTGIFRISHRQREHGDNGRYRRNQDRTDT